MTCATTHSPQVAGLWCTFSVTKNICVPILAKPQTPLTNPCPSISANSDWINRKGSCKEVGCIHTTQGYDLNYAGIIFGEEIRYDRKGQTIVIEKKNYHDRTGGQGIKDPAELKQYIINIYRTIMLRSIRGTFVYACDEALRDYLKQHIPVHASSQSKLKAANVVELQPYVNAVPLFNLQAAAGDFSDLQAPEHKTGSPYLTAFGCGKACLPAG